MLASASALTGCRKADYGPTSRRLGRTEVVFIGTLHERHLRSEEYPLARVTELLELVSPTAILVQAPPHQVEALTDPDHSWLDALPEVGTALEFARERNLPVAGISGWTPERAQRWRQYRERFPDGPDDPAYRRARDYLVRRSKQEGGTEIEWLSSPLYRRLTAWTDRTRARALNGDPATPEWRAERLLFDQALRAFPGDRIAVVFDARRLWVLEEELESFPAHAIDLRAFLPQ